jgi:purine-nucleoside phosphorylase
MGLKHCPGLAIVAGTGWQSVMDRLEAIAAIDLSSLPGCRAPTVQGHGGQLVCCRNDAGKTALLATGRVHLYEGAGSDSVTALVHCLASAGVRRLLLTNASGGLNPAFKSGDIMVVNDDLNLTWNKATDHASGAGALYDRALINDLTDAARAVGIPLKHGVYAGVQGPNFETRAEIRMLRRLGASIVGMSTTLEARCARALGMRVAALSLVTNTCSEIKAEDLGHEQVLETAEHRSSLLTRLLHAAMQRLA